MKESSSKRALLLRDTTWTALVESAAEAGLDLDILAAQIFERWLKVKKTKRKKRAKIPWAPLDAYLPPGGNPFNLEKEEENPLCFATVARRTGSTVSNPNSGSVEIP
jgi:hypothetical protein